MNITIEGPDTDGQENVENPPVRGSRTNKEWHEPFVAAPPRGRRTYTSGLGGVCINWDHEKSGVWYLPALQHDLFRFNQGIYWDSTGFGLKPSGRFNRVCRLDVSGHIEYKAGDALFQSDTFITTEPYRHIERYLVMLVYDRLGHKLNSLPVKDVIQEAITTVPGPGRIPTGIATGIPLFNRSESAASRYTILAHEVIQPSYSDIFQDVDWEFEVEPLGYRRKYFMKGTRVPFRFSVNMDKTVEVIDTEVALVDKDPRTGSLDLVVLNTNTNKLYEVGDPLRYLHGQYTFYFTDVEQ